MTALLAQFSFWISDGPRTAFEMYDVRGHAERAVLLLISMKSMEFSKYFDHVDLAIQGCRYIEPGLERSYPNREINLTMSISEQIRTFFAFTVR